jgi:hypothetical protein
MNERHDTQLERTAARDGRGQRLASALRANLLRRKKQALARSCRSEREFHGGTAGADSGGPTDPPETPHDSAEIIPDKTVG